MASLPDVQLSYGPMLIGVFLNMILYGVFVGQALTYYQFYHKDGAWMRYFVFYLFVLETLNTGFDMAMMYQPLILQFGQKPNDFPTMLITEPIMVVLVSTPIQIFFAWRIYTLTKLTSIPSVISVFAVASLAGGLWTAAKVGLIKLFIHKPELHTPALLWFVPSAAADVLITASLVWTLGHRKTGFVATDSVIDKIIRTTIQTGMVTAIFSVLDVICFEVFPHYSINFVWDLALSKLYSNALLSTLNARARLAAISTSRPTRSHLPSGTGAHALVFEDMARIGAATGTSKFDELETGLSMDEGQEEKEDEDKDDVETGSGSGSEIVETPRIPMPAAALSPRRSPRPRPPPSPSLA